MKGKAVIGIMAVALQAQVLTAQKLVTDATISYAITTLSNNAPAKNNALDGATSVLYLKAGISRVEMLSTLGKETTIFDSRAGTGVILKEYSGQKLMITLTKDNWASKNSRYDGVIFQTTTETKMISGYDCKKAVAKLKDGSSVVVYYATEVDLVNKDVLPLFKSLQGLPVQYEFQNNGLTFVYTLTKMDLNPVPVIKFEFPKTGYRTMTYEETLQQKKS